MPPLPRRCAWLQWSRRGFNLKPCAVFKRRGSEDFDTRTHRGIHHVRIILDIFCDAPFANERIRCIAFELKVGKAVVPHRAVGDQSIPARCAPRFCNPVFLKNQMRYTLSAQMFAKRDARLPRAHDQRIYLFNRQTIPSRRAISASVLQAAFCNLH